MPAIRPNALSNGVATDVDMVSALAPGNWACTLMVGKSTCGNDDTGKFKNAKVPAKPIAMVSRVVATGLLMKMAEKLIISLALCHL